MTRGWGGDTGVGEVAAEARAGGHRGACAEGEVWGSGVAEAEEADGGASGPRRARRRWPPFLFALFGPYSIF